MKDAIPYEADTLNAAKTVAIPKDFPYYKRGVSYTEVEVTIEYDGVVAGVIEITAKRQNSTDPLEPLENGTFTASEGAKSVTYYGSFDSITATPDSAFIAAAGTYKLIINAGENY